MSKIEVCFAPPLFHLYKSEDSIVVIVDILRATSAICAAFDRGAEKIIPVATIEEARKYKEQGFLVAAERDGVVLDFADFGNSPENFTEERVKGKTVVYSTTNGTQAIMMAEGCKSVAIASYLNHRVISEWLISQENDIVIFCSGWKDRFSLEDSVYAGALAETLMNSGKFTNNCDSAMASLDLWEKAKPDLQSYIKKASHRKRLKKLVMEHVVEYCHTFDLFTSLPVLEKNYLINLKRS